MFERFTERARAIMSNARKRAERMDSEFISTEHILLGVIDDGGGVAGKLLKAKGVTVEKVDAEIKKLVTPSAGPRLTLGQLPFSPRAKRVIELAGEASSAMGQEVVGSEHLLIALIRETEGIAWEVLKKVGMGAETVPEIYEILGAPAPQEGKICRIVRFELAVGVWYEAIYSAPTEGEAIAQVALKMATDVGNSKAAGAKFVSAKKYV